MTMEKISVVLEKEAPVKGIVAQVVTMLNGQAQRYLSIVFFYIFIYVDLLASSYVDASRGVPWLGAHACDWKLDNEMKYLIFSFSSLGAKRGVKFRH